MAEVGQIWMSADPRDNGRRVRVQECGESFAFVVRVDARGLPFPRARRTRIRLDANGNLPRYRKQ